MGHELQAALLAGLTVAALRNGWHVVLAPPGAAVTGDRPGLVAAGSATKYRRRSTRPSPELTKARITLPDGAAASTRQPHRLVGDGLVAYLAGGHAIASVR
jgi:hypothetical protein